MDISDFGWERQPQEVKEGDYWFNGKILATKGISENLLEGEIMLIIADAINFAIQNQGIDYLVVYKHKTSGQKLFFIDQVTKSDLQQGHHPPEHNYATLMFAEEY